ncbi:alpha/beta fold hydrolase [Petropleomorpha daqingensis]|uniref:Pimeloyl-ACP methyl ester carboxylesterase n=1 Tax=Petropleomorpha daqingensis TaxID=2026353 RepID=A0A853C8N3_9ACTN|nr:alpha/beta hydrolase [Petropleomorpha daqingensis]NYJ04265.1 pimeloyl-ACP methyl ester carboxylesterase [Petropleomorpha daqingensis]
MSDLAVDRLESVQLGGITQWIRVRAADPSNPPLLLMQQGPGLPVINEAHGWDELLGLERDWTVVYWDQRGTGLSARPLLGRSFPISAPRMVEDTVALLELLRERFGRPAAVLGFSFGATYAAYAAQRRPDLVALLVGVGMDIDMPAGEHHTYEFALRTARIRGNSRAVRQLRRIGPPPHLTGHRLRTRARWAADFGGISVHVSYRGILGALLRSLIRSPDYSVAGGLRTLLGMAASQTALLPDLADTDLVGTVPALDVPVVLIQGRHDQVAPGTATRRFHDALRAPSKRLVWFEDSAHTPHLDEPERFRALLTELRAEQYADA